MNEEYQKNDGQESVQGANFVMSDNNTEPADNTTSTAETTTSTVENNTEAQESTYHRSYINDNDPNARTYINDRIEQKPENHGEPKFYAGYDPQGSYTNQGNGYYNQQGYQGSNGYSNSGYNNNYQNGNGGGYQNSYTGYTAPKKQPKPKKKMSDKAKKTWGFIGKAAAFGAIAGCIMLGMNVAFYKMTDKPDVSNKTTTTTGTAGTVKTTSGGGKTDTSEVSKLVKNVMPSIVSITSTFDATNGSDFNSFYYWFYGGNDSNAKEQTGSGSGVVIGETDKQLMIVTNNHVISDNSYGDATKVQVTFSDDKTVDATVKGTDSDADLAVLTVNKSDMEKDTLESTKIAVLGDSDSMNVGDSVVAIGNALGYGQSVTRGIVSAMNRDVQLEDRTMTLLQTDAAINPGNSGGALLNMNGELIGINSVKYASDAVEGMGYAIPMVIAQPIIEELMNEEEVKASDAAYLGIYGNDISTDLSGVYDMPEGVWVKEVTKNSPAEDAGIQQRDIIVKFNDHKITTMKGLQEQIAKKKAGTEVTITLKRQDSDGGYKDVELKVTLGRRSEAGSEFDNYDNNNRNKQQEEQDNQTQENIPFFGDGFDNFFGN